MLAPAAEGVGADAETLSAADTLKAKAVPRGAATPAAGSNANSTTDALEHAHTAARSDAGTQRNALRKGDGDFGVGDLEAAALGCSCHTGGAPEIMTGVGARPAAQAVASDQYTRGAAVAATGRWLIRMAQRAMATERGGARSYFRMYTVPCGQQPASPSAEEPSTTQRQVENANLPCTDT
jgi:hypothetical protein